MQDYRGKRSSEAKKRRRRIYRLNKKRSHKSQKEGWELLSEEALRQRSRERCKRVEAAHLVELKEREQRKEKKRLAHIEQETARVKERAEKELAVEMTHQCYDAKFNVTVADNHCSTADTSPIVLDSLLSPISEPTSRCTNSPVHSARCKQLLESARKERDKALSLARVYRDMAENSQTQKRILKANLEKKVEIVRDFWRNKVVEGSTRSGRMLRAALLKN